VPFDHHPHIIKRRHPQHAGNDEQLRERPRPIWPRNRPATRLSSTRDRARGASIFKNGRSVAAQEHGAPGLRPGRRDFQAPCREGCCKTAVRP